MRTVAAFGGERRELARYDGLLEAAMRRRRARGPQGRGRVRVALLRLRLLDAATFKFSGEYMFGPKGDFETGGDVIMTFFAAIIGVASVSDAAMPLNAVVGGLSGRRAHARGDRRAERDRARRAAPGAPADAAPALARVDELRFEDVQFAYPSRARTSRCCASVSFAIAAARRSRSSASRARASRRSCSCSSASTTPTAAACSSTAATCASSRSRVRARVGFVGQEPVLFAASVLENLRVSAPGATEEQCRAAARQAEALDFLEKLPEGVHSYVGQGGSQMSGGQKQRIAIARAIVKRPALLLLDEATSALDNASEKLVQKTMQATLDGLQHDGQLTVISIAHRLSTVRNADRIFCLEDGAVAESGTHDAGSSRARRRRRLSQAGWTDGASGRGRADRHARRRHSANAAADAPAAR